MPVDVVKVATDELEFAYEILNEVYTPDRPMSFSGTTEHASFVLNGLQLGDVGVARIRHNLNVRSLTPPFDDVIGGTVIAGPLRWASAKQDVRLRTGEVLLHPMSAASETDVSGLDYVHLRIPRSAVERLATEYAGVPSTQFRFDGMLPINEAAAAQWRALTAYLQRTLGCLDADGALLAARLVDLVAATALAVFPNTTMTVTRAQCVGPVAPAALRRAVAHIEAHATEPITLSDIAEAAGTTGRAIQAAFRRHYDTTPMSYLRNVRLEHAHRELQASDPTSGATVAAIAATWGFGKSARFAEFYRDRFGVSPSRTLRT